MKTEIWDKVARPPKDALKQIKGGRLKGMTDINPQWRFQVMTELFGPCGIGWRFEVVNIWSEEGANAEKAAFALVNLFIKQDEKWSDAIPGVGGNSLIAKESAGLRTNDEAYKMAVTDALSTAMKAIGVGADIYAGRWDGSKYAEKEAPPTVKIDQKQKKAFYDQAIKCLEEGDEHGLKELWAEWGNEEKVVLWGMFNSQQRSTMKQMQGT